MKQRNPDQSQGGYALIELALGLLIASLLAAWGAQAWVNRLNDAQAQSAAVWMEAVHKAVLGYVQRHGPAIQEAETEYALSAHGFQDWRAPSLDELAQAGLLSSGMPLAIRPIGSARIHVWKRGDCPGDSCIVEALVHSERPFLDERSGEVNQAMVAQWLLAANGEGAAVHPDKPDHIRGIRFAFSSSLPDGTILPAGTVGMAVTAEHQALWSFLRVRDRRDPDFQGGLTVAEHVQGGGDADFAGHLVLGAGAQTDAACSPENAIAHDIRNGGLLVCFRGRWRSSGKFGGAYGYNIPNGCRTPEGLSTANPITRDCSCPLYTVPTLVYDSGPPDPMGGPSRGRQSVYICIG